MRLLLLGGTAFLGRAIAQTAVTRGHDVTCVARGESGQAPSGTRFVRTDRDVDGSLTPLADTTWDVLVDVSRQPGHVRRACAELEASVRHTVFVSSGNAYADHGPVGTPVTAERLAPLEGDVMESMEVYGQAKVACEDHVLRTFGPERTTVVRAGLIGGPGDVSGRTGWYPWRFAHPVDDGGRVLVADALDAPNAGCVDVRDLVAWLVELAEGATAGVFNGSGPTRTLGEMVETARRVSGEAADPVAAEPRWLTDRGVTPWMGPDSLPLWLGEDPEWAGFNTLDNTSALAAGLRLRPVEETVRDTLAWEERRPADAPRQCGLSDDTERRLLAALG